MKLYHYVHCPFCVRIRMVLGYLQQDFESIVLPYDDEKTPTDLMGVKMLPIMQIGNKTSNESLDIISMLDNDNRLSTKEEVENYSNLEPILNEFGSNVHSLAMPYWIWTKEFDENSREYFQKKKELKRGPFSKLVHNQKEFISGLNKSLEQHKDLFNKVVTKDTIKLNDILIASHLWGMYIVPEYQFEPTIHRYLQSVKTACNFHYHEDYWRL